MAAEKPKVVRYAEIHGKRDPLEVSLTLYQKPTSVFSGVRQLPV